MPQNKQFRMILLVTTVTFVLFFIAIIFKTGVILNSMKNDAKAENKSVIILTSDVITDQSWGSLAYKGKLIIEQQYPVSVEMFSELDTDKKIIETLDEALQTKPDVIIGHGREFSSVLAKFAPDYPSIEFVTVHGNSTYPNQAVYTFDQQEIEYIAGILAGMKTKSNKVGLIDAFEARDKNLGFETGLHKNNTDSEFYYSVVDSRDDEFRAVQIAKQMIAQGVDVIFSKGNAYNQSVIDYAKEQGVYVIGYLDDQAYMGKNIVLTSILNDVSQTYVAIMEDYFSSGIPSGKTILNQSDGVYQLAPYGPMVTEEEKGIIEFEISQMNKLN